MSHLLSVYTSNRNSRTSFDDRTLCIHWLWTKTFGHCSFSSDLPTVWQLLAYRNQTLILWKNLWENWKIIFLNTLYMIRNYFVDPDVIHYTACPSTCGRLHNCENTIFATSGPVATRWLQTVRLTNFLCVKESEQFFLHKNTIRDFPYLLALIWYSCQNWWNMWEWKPSHADRQYVNLTSKELRESLGVDDEDSCSNIIILMKSIGSADVTLVM